MTKHVRVREGNWEYTIPASRLSDGVEVIEKSPYSPNGRVAPPKPVTPLGTPAPGSKQERKRATKKSAAPRRGTEAGQTSADTKKE